jgi:hypothetical protein
LLKRTLFAVVVIVFLMSSCYVVSPINAQASRLPGVQAGDWAKYDVALNYSTNDPDPLMTKPPLGDIEYYKLEVQSVDNTNITYQTIMRYLNGTEMSMPSSIDISSGQMNFGYYSSYGPLIAANLTAGDKIYLNSLSATINATSTGTCAGRQREVNCLDMIMNSTYPYSSQQTQFGEMKFLWDKMSGIFVAVNESMVFADISKGYTTQIAISLIITETNIWSPVPAVEAEVFIVPNLINLRSNGKWILVFVELPEGYKAKNIELSTVMMNDTISVEGRTMIIGKRWLLVRFDRNKVISLILSSTHSKTKFMVVTLTITGKLNDGSIFQGSDEVIAMLPPSRRWKAHED